jgi:prolyl-tRNA synthetase
VCEEILKILEDNNYEVLFDDREVTPGIKFNDADLIGLPIQILVGDKNLKENKIEVKIRKTDERTLIGVNELLDIIKKIGIAI